MEWISILVSALISCLRSDEVRWAGVLDGLDDLRATAFATADPSLLGQVYVPRSRARADDAALIHDYERRGARVDGATLVLLSVRIRFERADRVELDVVDRLAQARVVWADGTTRALPRDLPTRRTVTLLHVSDGWRIAN